MNKKTKKSMIAVLVLCLSSFTAGEDKAFANHEPNTSKPWSGRLESGFIHDSNIFQVRGNKESDLIWESALTVSYRPNTIKWSGKGIFDRYRKNSDLDYSTYELGGEAPFGKREYGSLFFFFSPSASLDKQDPNRDPFALKSYGFNAAVDHDTDRFGNIGLTFFYTRLDYGAPFDAKDTDILGFGPSIFYRPNTLWHLYGEYTYEVGSARGGEIPVNFPDDISYEAQVLSLKVTRQMTDNTNLRLRYRLRQKHFTTNGADVFHSGRRDNNHSLYTEIKYFAIEKVAVYGRVERIWRRSNDDFVSFDENRFTVSLAYAF